ncbi:MAG: hypothetical protein PSX37_11990, partial [bacterium]|nr:hypothetical protein [bacterium]
RCAGGALVAYVGKGPGGDGVFHLSVGDVSEFVAASVAAPLHVEGPPTAGVDGVRGPRAGR